MSCTDSKVEQMFKLLLDGEEKDLDKKQKVAFWQPVNKAWDGLIVLQLYLCTEWQPQKSVLCFREQDLHFKSLCREITEWKVCKQFAIIGFGSEPSGDCVLKT